LENAAAQLSTGTASGRALKAAVNAALFALLGCLLSSVPAHAAEECLTCHIPGGGLTNSKGKNIEVHADALKKSVHAGVDCVGCHAGAAKEGHTTATAAPSCVTCHADESTHLSSSAHAALGSGKNSAACIACHGGHSIASPQQLGDSLCATCHKDQTQQFARSIHGREGGRSTGDAPHCDSCHGSAHRALPASDVRSLVSKVNLPATCGRCHSDPEFMSKYLMAVAKPVEAYEASVHGKAVRAGRMDAASCNDCHGVHDILPVTDSRSAISRTRVAETCGKCHEPIFAAYRESIHARAVAAGISRSPTCATCHGEHQIMGPEDPRSPVAAPNVSSMTCASCHDDTRLLARLDMPAGRVTSYESSFHGLAARSGRKTVANCASCHGVHNILPSTDPRSTIAPANLAKTCGQCHPGAGTRYAIGPVHVVAASAETNPLLYYVRVFYLFTIPVVLGFMFLHNLLDWWRKARRKLNEYRLSGLAFRLTLSERIQHVLLLTSFITLVVTGFALKFPESFWAAPIVAWEENYPIRGWVHRIAGVVLIGASVYHLIYVVFWKSGRRWMRAMLPRVRDVREAVHAAGYYLGYRRNLPTFAKFNYAEKMEYWALVWGTIVMAATGILLWAHDFVLRNLSMAWIDVSTAIHYYEAILATAAIVIWHFYFVIFDPDIYPLKWTFLTGKAPHHEVREEEPEPPPASATATAAPAQDGANSVIEKKEV
jgi:formate dehydrogenase gamma subunit